MQERNISNGHFLNLQLYRSGSNPPPPLNFLSWITFYIQIIRPCADFYNHLHVPLLYLSLFITISFRLCVLPLYQTAATCWVESLCMERFLLQTVQTYCPVHFHMYYIVHNLLLKKILQIYLTRDIHDCHKRHILTNGGSIYNIYAFTLGMPRLFILYGLDIYCTKREQHVTSL